MQECMQSAFLVHVIALACLYVQQNCDLNYFYCKFSTFIN